MQTWHALLLGLIEGLTEFLPVSSTGHLVLAGHFLGVDSPKKVFEILIQLGAILAILTVYAAKIIRILVDLPRDKHTQRFVLAVLVAFLPAAEFSFFLAMPTMAGAFAYDLFKNYKEIDAAALQTIALGFVVAFVTGVVVVRYLLDFVSRRGFAPFAWWRIIIGGMGLGALAVLG